MDIKLIKKIMKILGIDEAGKGPVIGPMIIAGVMIDEKDLEKLSEMKDSKLLLHKKRIFLAEIIKKICKYHIIEVSSEVIDEAILSNELNLNWLEAYKQAEIINELKPDKVFVDCPSINCSAFEKYLRNLVKNKNIEMVVEHKADFKYKIVSAASILAKVKREEEMDKIRNKYGETGSGYPADPKTKLFLQKNWNKHPEIFRKSWSTYKKISEKPKQKKLF